MNAVSEFLSLREVGEFALHPDGVAVGAVGDGAVDGAVAAALEAVVALAGTGGVPVEEDVGAEETAGDGAGFVVGFTLGLGGVFGLERGLVGVGGGSDGGEDGVVEALEVGGGEPFVFNLLEGVAGLAGLFGGGHEVVEGLEVGVG